MDDISKHRGFDQILHDAAEYRVLRRIYEAAKERAADKSPSMVPITPRHENGSKQ